MVVPVLVAPAGAFLAGFPRGSRLHCCHSPVSDRRATCLPYSFSSRFAYRTAGARLRYIFVPTSPLSRSQRTAQTEPDDGSALAAVNFSRSDEGLRWCAVVMLILPGRLWFGLRSAAPFTHLLKEGGLVGAQT